MGRFERVMAWLDEQSKPKEPEVTQPELPGFSAVYDRRLLTLRVPKRNIGGLVVGGVLIATASTYGACHFMGDLSAKLEQHHNPLLAPVARDSGIKGLELYYGSDNKDVIPQIWQSARRSLINVGDYILKTKFDNNTENFIGQARYSMVIDGLDLLKRQGIVGIEVDQDKKVAVFPSIGTFDLSKVYDLVLLDQIINEEVNASVAKSGEEKTTAQVNVEDLKWLKNSGLKIKIDGNTFVFDQKDQILFLAKFYRFAQAAGYPFPSKVIFSPRPPKLELGGDYDDITKEIYLTDVTKGRSSVHEGSHQQADMNGKFSQSNFDKAVSAAIEKLSREGKKFDSGLPYVSDYAKKNSKEDYAETFADYFTDGVEFRRKLYGLKYSSDAGENAAYFVLKAKYDFAKGFFDGKEFIRAGEEFAPGVDNVFKVADAGDPPGVKLRKNYNDPAGTGPLIFDETAVLLQSYVDVVDRSTGSVRRFWSVKAGDMVKRGGVLVFEPKRDIYGYISQEWLGERVLADGNSGSGSGTGKN